MKVLSIKQPWADAILYGGKRVENRTWMSSYRGPLALHASRTPDADAPNVDYRHPLYRYLYHDNGITGPDVRGAIVGLATLTDVHWSQRIISDDPAYQVGRHAFCDCDEWGDRGPTVTHLVLTDVRPVTPYPYRGSLGLRDVPDDVAAILQGR